MRKKSQFNYSGYRIIAVDDEIGIIDSLAVVLKRSGYDFVGETNPLKAIERIKREHFDLLILDYFMNPFHGDEVVECIRKFNKDLYILLLTGHSDLAPPLETINKLDIQGYCVKGSKFDQLLLLVESGIKSIAMLQTIKKFQEGLNLVLQAVPKIYQLLPLDRILEEILSEIMPLVDSEHAFILIDDVSGNGEESKSIFRGIGRYNTPVKGFMDLLHFELMEQIGEARMSKAAVLSDEGIALPLLNELNQVLGVIYVDHSLCEWHQLEQDIKVLEIFTKQAASALSNAYLHSLVNIKNDELKSTYSQLHRSYMDTIEALRQVVDAKDYYTRGHSDRVAYYSILIGVEMGLDESDLELLKISSFFHDIGKIGTAEDILTKADKLSASEYEEIKKHPLKGAQILSAVSMLKDVVPIVQNHHERIDGNGYPMGLQGDQIPLFSRIIAVADAYDAMTSDRHYRKKLDPEIAKEQLLSGRGTQFDSMVVNKFIGVLENHDNRASSLIDSQFKVIGYLCS